MSSMSAGKVNVGTILAHVIDSIFFKKINSKYFNNSNLESMHNYHLPLEIL